ncbi:17-beta-hydroxysteroid dehydrogenase type 6-like [Brevipalpus obovatus]|uniref:17-beta-hydroxysteroid dehydrogenase type 6-like n=1 Tax=Brevipalpus obovatus TaxID=246614 RepID=UPI003D9E1E90
MDILDTIRGFFSRETGLFIVHIVFTLITTFILFITQDIFGYFIFAIACPIFAVRLAWIFLHLSKFGNGEGNSRRDRIRTDGKAVLITGCDSGFGHRAAIWLNQRGFNVIATCLQLDSDQSQSLLVKARYPAKMNIIKLNVMDSNMINSAYESVERILNATGDQLYGLINNAGVLNLLPIESGLFEENCGRTMDINFWGVVKVTRKFLPLIRKSKGRIVTITSTASRHPTALYSAYAASKHAAKAFMVSLRYELLPFDVRVIEIEPGMADTPIIDFQRWSSLYKASMQYTPAHVREDYGWSSGEDGREDNIEQLQKSFQTFKGILQTHRIPSRVVHTMVESLMHSNPRDVYVINGTFFTILEWILQFVDQEVKYLWTSGFYLLSGTMKKR